MTDIEPTPTSRPPTPTAPSRWDPFAELEAWLGRGPGQRLPWASLWGTPDGVDFTPAADIEETDKAWSIDLELPGVDKDDIDVETHGRTVVIRGERKQKEREGVVRQKRRVTGTFRYEVTLPGEIDLTAIEAKLDNGELVVTVPKSEAEKPLKIKVS
ncbi:MAG: Hsp20/alpha crystallin family protein [Acidimicrobiales bacterium]